VRDDGDVDAFYIRHIVSAIERRAEPRRELGVGAEEIRPFFHRNVGISAWGLDIHTFVKWLQKKNYQYEVRIFKFGLLKTEDLYHDGSEELDQGNAGFAGPSDRREDVTIQILNGNSNIPAISFCNIPNIDPEGRWLLTTDIAGITRLVDLKTLTAVRTFKFNGSWFRFPAAFDQRNAGWGVLFLDPRAFAAAASFQEALGNERQTICQTLAGKNGEHVVLDISRTASKFSESRAPLRYHRPMGRRWDGDLVEHGQGRAVGRNITTEMDFEEYIGDGNANDEDGDNSTDETERGVSSQSSSMLPMHTHAAVSGSSPRQVNTHPLETSSNQSTTVTPSHNSPSIASINESEDSDTDLAALIDDGEDDGGYVSNMSVMENTPRFLGLRGRIDACADNEDDDYDNDNDGNNNIQANGNRSTEQQNHPILPDPILPACPILCTSVRNFYLLQPFPQGQPSNTDNRNPSSPQGSPSTQWTFPMVGLASPLRQRIHADFAYLLHYERLNMQLSISELGVVVLASQKGRAIVLELTKLRAEVLNPPKTANCGGGTGKGGRRKKANAPTKASTTGGTKYCFRAAAILPFAHQERANERPFAPLLGIAGAPLQGCTSDGVDGDSYGEGKQGRWRLLLVYQDHGVLSYEISRTRHSFEIGDVMV